MEIKEQLKEEKPAMNLEATIKLALDLNRRINQTGKLLETIGTLEVFEVAQEDDAEETDSTHFQRCELTIEDDIGREFTTKTLLLSMQLLKWSIRYALISWRKSRAKSLFLLIKINALPCGGVFVIIH